MENNFYKFKNYAHFDKRLTIQNAKWKVESSKYVSTHSFYPFLHYTLKLHRYYPKEEDQKEKHKSKPREIYYAAHIDRYIYQYYSHMLNERYNRYCIENEIDDYAIAYRTNKKGKSNIDFAYDAFSFLKVHNKSIVIVGDFSHFFDNLDHLYLKQCLLKVLDIDRLTDDWFKVFKNICCFSYVDVHSILDYNKSVDNKGLSTTLHQLNKQEVAFDIAILRKEYKEWIHTNEHINEHYGIPQGSPISGILANVYMIEFDKLMMNLCYKFGGFYRRYSDDFIFIMPNSTEDEITFKVSEVFDVKNLIASSGRLMLEPDKTKCFYYIDTKIKEYSCQGDLIEIENPKINFLGFSFDGLSIDFRDKTKHKNINKTTHKARQLYKLNGKKRKKDCSKIYISLKSMKVFFSIYKGKSGDKNRQMTTFNTYVKNSSKKFKKERKIVMYLNNRKSRVYRLTNRVVAQQNRQLSDDIISKV
ncbi:MAG: reverse transcriptase/maturase family protein [Clostridia bacterium]|nr:reverse transcriptase/maturase family protein [Clostridia bacterium]